MILDEDDHQDEEVLFVDYPNTITVNNSAVIGKMQAITVLSANPLRDIKIKSQRRNDEAMFSLPFASDDRDFQTIQQMAT
jgi:hypothetical protein